MRQPGPLTTRAFAALPSSSVLAEAGGAGGSSLLQSLVAQEQSLQSLFRGEWPTAEPPEFVLSLPAPRPSACDVDVDVAVCGGTLGILVGCALQLRGHRVAVVEAGPLRGRAQDWNTSEEELRRLVSAGLLTEEELHRVAPLRFGPMRCKFGATPASELQLRGVLDVAVSPTALLEAVSARFQAAGGLVLENSPVREVRIHPDGAALALGQGGAGQGRTLHSRLVVDAMGHRSPLALQARRGQRPDGVCVQVGSCARGAWARQWRGRGDFFVTEDDARYCGPRRCARAQLFWQSFPSSGGEEERSTYLFTYLRPSEQMPGLLELMEEYWYSLPAYQRCSEADEVAPSRILFGWFPTYRSNSPLKPAFDRVISVGDASAVQSPISFGGFCAMLRHLPRYSRGIDAALRQDRLSRAELAWLAPYFPNLGTAWMSAAAMTARADAAAPAAAADAAVANAAAADTGMIRRSPPEADEPYTLVNQLLAGNFAVMEGLPREEALVFFRDVTTFRTLLAVLVGQTATMAPLLPRVVAELVGPLELLEFGGHFVLLGLYTLLHSAAEAGGSRGGRHSDFFVVSALDALAFGSGLEEADAEAAAGREVEVEEGETPWWRRPPRTWPPRIDDFQLVVGDVVASYSSAFVCVDVLAAGGGEGWVAEGSAVASAWIVGAAVTNAWDPTAVLPSLGYANALACVARASVDFASTRVLLALAGAVLARQAVDVRLLTQELVVGAASVAAWRSLYFATSEDRR